MEIPAWPRMTGWTWMTTSTTTTTTRLTRSRVETRLVGGGIFDEGGSDGEVDNLFWEEELW